MLTDNDSMIEKADINEINDENEILIQNANDKKLLETETN